MKNRTPENAVEKKSARRSACERDGANGESFTRGNFCQGCTKWKNSGVWEKF